MNASTPGPEADLIERAAAVILAEWEKPHTGPYQWAGALWREGMLVVQARTDEEEVWWELLHEAMGLPLGQEWDQVSRVMNRVVRPLLADIARGEHTEPTRYEWGVHLDPERRYIQVRPTEEDARRIHVHRLELGHHSKLMRRSITISNWEEAPE